MDVLRPVVLAVLALDGLCLSLLLVSAAWAVRISLYWDPESTSAIQHRLESRVYLTSSTIAFALAFKLPAALLFLFAIDALATDIPGAMCGVGVLEAMPWGWRLLLTKLVLLYGLAFWMLVNRRDMRSSDWRHTRFKYGLFHVLLAVMVLETVMEWAAFLALRTDRLVSCCSSLFSDQTPGFASNLLRVSPAWYAAAVLLSYLVMAVGTWRRQTGLLTIANLVFLPLALLTLVDVISPYVYELPHHRCPFCLLQAGSHFIGFPLYAALFYGTFRGMAAGCLSTCLGEDPGQGAWHALAANGLFLIMAFAYPLIYHLRHGVWL